MTQNTPKIVNCPSCQKPVTWTEDNKYRPFCSDHCRILDLGDWAAEKHSIVGEPFYPVEQDEKDPLQ
ncbi:MAG: DNA gyrase inhibitor YacG [Gammaproteobacteria bacterium]|nr:DNA gyrase inhibitor YacG [Gammaproteobacteria bacterium]MCY4358718.1 DNA gyrase inhibitor YacG [Gammaproteobacteria bacterium]